VARAFLQQSSNTIWSETRVGNEYRSPCPGSKRRTTFDDSRRSPIESDMPPQLLWSYSLAANPEDRVHVVIAHVRPRRRFVFRVKREGELGVHCVRKGPINIIIKFGRTRPTSECRTPHKAAGARSENETVGNERYNSNASKETTTACCIGTY
jgi:hypothetical protein